MLCRAYHHIQDEYLGHLVKSQTFGWITEPVRYDFKRVEVFDLTNVSSYTRLSGWMNTLHFYGRTSLAESVMQDGVKAYSDEKVKDGIGKQSFHK